MAIDLLWLPLGAGGHSVRFNGIVYEALAARIGGREARDLYHAALRVYPSSGPAVVIEMAPVWSGTAVARGVVAEGAVGSRRLGRFRAFRYEIRRWPNGTIDDELEAVESPIRVSDDPAAADRLLALVPSVPALVWGRDELAAGEMWNSNSMIAWLLSRAGLDVAGIQLPAGGRAPGWDSGRRAAADPELAEKAQRPSAQASQSAHVQAHERCPRSRRSFRRRDP